MRSHCDFCLLPEWIFFSDHFMLVRKMSDHITWEETSDHVVPWEEMFVYYTQILP